jgi:hypothetical protein
MSDFLEEGNPDWGWEFVAEDFVFARLREEREAAETLPAAERSAVLNRVEGLWSIACWHSAYLDSDGKSRGRCFTCDLTNGFPCSTMCGLAKIWRNHGDFQEFWGRRQDHWLEDVFKEGGFRRAFLAKRAKRESEEGSA